MNGWGSARAEAVRVLANAVDTRNRLKEIVDQYTVMLDAAQRAVDGMTTLVDEMGESWV